MKTSFSLLLNRCAFIVVLAVIILLISWFLSKKTPSVDQIGSWEGATAACHMSVPQGTRFSLLLGVPSDDGQNISDVTGRVTVASAHGVLLDHPITSGDIVPASWLSRKGLQGYILTGHGNESAHAFSSALSQAKEVDVTVTLMPAPSTNATLWVGYLQSVFHRMF